MAIIQALINKAVIIIIRNEIERNLKKVELADIIISIKIH